MAYSFKMNVPEDSPEGKAIAALVEKQHVSPRRAVELLIKQAVQAEKVKSSKKKTGDLWGSFADDAEVLDQIVNEAMMERRHQFERHLNA
jgi:hypothetical protein